MSDNKRPLKVFLCHASADKPKIRELYRRLVHDGIDAWLDETKLLPGMEWQVEIPKAVREADAIIICLSKNSVTKEGYVQKEIRFALDVADEKPDGTIYLIPVRLEECAVPSRLVRWQWVDLFTTDGYRKLRRSLRLRADAIGAGFSSLGRRPETENHAVQVSPNPTETSDGDEYTFNFGLTMRLFAVLTLVILVCAGIFWAATWMTRELAAQTPSPAPTLLSAASFTPEPPVATASPSPTPLQPSPIPTETLTPFIPPTPTNPPTTTATPVLIYVVVSPTWMPTATATMVLIPGGYFLMGNADGEKNEKPSHTVHLEAFYLDPYEVTNLEYSHCVNSGVCKRAIVPMPNTPKDYDSAERYYNYPVVYVSWYMAKTYCEWLSERLPTEAEWEMAARGRLEKSRYPWGEKPPSCAAGTLYGAQFASCEKGAVEIGTFAPNGYYLYDMVGNVWEWVSDWYGENTYAQTNANALNPQGPDSGSEKVVRGGGWANTDIYLARRSSAYPTVQDDEIGFRCARDAKP